jgi:Trk-type K+ transport system membrane component
MSITSIVFFVFVSGGLSYIITGKLFHFLERKDHLDPDNHPFLKDSFRFIIHIIIFLFVSFLLAFIVDSISDYSERKRDEYSIYKETNEPQRRSLRTT